MGYKAKPGVALRATAAFALLNLPLIGTVAFSYMLAGGSESEWWIRGILAVGVAVSELAIVINTIGPPLKDWIKSAEWVDEPDKRRV
jgi:hypothetical protein